MNTPRPSLTRLLLFLCLAIPFALPAAAPAPEKAKIESLIGNIEALQEASFVRNGKTYDAKVAAKFLRGKWEAKEAKVQTAQDFIQQAASQSSTTGQPYLIRFKDGREVKCADYLKEQLKKLDPPASK